MVKRVFGAVDNQDVVFTPNIDTGLWETAVPADVDGEYVTELYAEDEAGNISYMATVLFAVDTSNMCVRVKVIRYATESSLIDYDADCSLTDIRAETIRCELCGRWSVIIMNKVNMLIGERRRLTVRITAGGQDFTIRNPKYKLMRSGEVIASGTPTVSGNDLICMLEPPVAGGYTMECTFEIAGEIVKKRVTILVEK